MAAHHCVTDLEVGPPLEQRASGGPCPHNCIWDPQKGMEDSPFSLCPQTKAFSGVEFHPE